MYNPSLDLCVNTALYSLIDTLGDLAVAQKPDEKDEANRLLFAFIEDIGECVGQKAQVDLVKSLYGAISGQKV